MASLYRTYRPRTFADVVGQEHVVRTLTGAVESDRIAHAYLFSGPRGTGKTSLAKILAKALNCVNGPTSEPCGVCDRCERIHSASALDVIELDAASHRGIDDIREIRERVAQQPVEGRYKVYILDEAHSLTSDASNALLKTLEEPPSHVVFVLCTTDPIKLLPTIRSRCQRFAFRRPSPGQLAEVLGRVCATEGIVAPDAAVHLIARAASGSFRDALTILDQLSTSTGGTIDVEEAARLLGLVPEEALSALVDQIADGDAGAVLRRVDQLAEAGQDLVGLLTALLDHLRLLYLLQHAGALPASESTSSDRLADLERQARALPASEVLRAVDALSGALREIRDGSDPRLPLEVALLAAARPQAQTGMAGLLARLERLEHGSPAPPAESPAERPVTVAPPAPVADAAPAPAPEPAPAVAAPPPAAPPQPAAVAPAALDLESVRDAWSEIVQHLRGPEGGVLRAARPVAAEGDLLTLQIAAPLVTSADRYAPNLAQAALEVLAQRIRVRFIAAPVAAPAAEPEPADSASEQADDDVPLLTGEELFARLRERTNATEVTE